MPTFKYVAVRADGATVTGEMKAVTASLVRSALAQHDLDPLEVKEHRSILQFEITRRRVPRKELMHFSRQLAVFIRAGIPVLDALNVIMSEAGNKLFKSTLAEMIEALRGGDTFAGAAAAHPDVFPAFYLGILRSAELTGSLDTVLDQLSGYIERDMDARRRLVSALVYPAVVFVMSLVTVIILTVFVLPRFESFFESLDAKLPFATRVLLSVSDFMSAYGVALLGGIALAVALAGLSMRTQRGRDVRDVILLRLPVVGEVVRHAIIERFCRVLSSMIGAGVPLPEAMAVTSDATNNVVYQRGLTKARDAMLRGEGLAEPLTATGLFPAAARQMFRVGEDTGTLDDQLATAAVYFDRELDYKIKSFTSLFEPAVILFMGAVVGFVAIALVAAMYGVFTQVRV